MSAHEDVRSAPNPSLIHIIQSLQHFWNQSDPEKLLMYADVQGAKNTCNIYVVYPNKSRINPT